MKNENNLKAIMYRIVKYYYMNYQHFKISSISFRLFQRFKRFKTVLFLSL